jgi:hypothetical protein
VSSAAAGRVPGQRSDAYSYQYKKLLGGVAGEEEIRERLAENRQSISVIPAATSPLADKPVSLT